MGYLVVWYLVGGGTGHGGTSGWWPGHDLALYLSKLPWEDGLGLCRPGKPGLALALAVDLAVLAVIRGSMMKSASTKKSDDFFKKDEKSDTFRENSVKFSKLVKFVKNRQ